MFGDRIFYPLAALVIAGMIWLALSFGGGQSFTDGDIISEGWELSGPDLIGLNISPGSNGEFINEDGGFMRLSQFTPSGQGPASIGVFATLGPNHERVFAGRPLRITFRARATLTNPLNQFDVNYYTMEALPSERLTFALGTDWADYVFDYTPPIVDARPNVDLIAVFPGRGGDQTQMDLASIRVEVLDAP